MQLIKLELELTIMKILNTSNISAYLKNFAPTVYEKKGKQEIFFTYLLSFTFTYLDIFYLLLSFTYLDITMWHTVL